MTAKAISEFICKGVRFPNGTALRAVHKGVTHNGTVKDGAFRVAKTRFATPSAAAKSITGVATDGWKFWECCFPGEQEWRLIKALRGKSDPGYEVELVLGGRNTGMSMPKNRGIWSFQVAKDGEVIGSLAIGKGSISWRPFNGRPKTYTWQDFASRMVSR